MLPRHQSDQARALVIWTAGGWNEDLPGDFVDAEAEYDAKCSRPLIQHEWRWWSSYPDVRIMRKYSGAVRPYAAEIAQEAASRQGLAHLLPQFAANSQRLQFLEAKAKMEMRRRDFPRLAGISQYSAADLNPSPQGILDEFYDRKYVDGATWLQTNGDTVILSSLQLDDRALSAGSTRQCRFFVSDFSHPAMTAPTVTWRLVAGDETLASGQLSYAHRPYCTCPAGVTGDRCPCGFPCPGGKVGSVAAGRRSYGDELLERVALSRQSTVATDASL